MVKAINILEKPINFSYYLAHSVVTHEPLFYSFLFTITKT